MDFKELCESKGGKWLSDVSGCKIDDGFFYKENRDDCFKAGDSFENFKGTGLKVCREVPIQEYCEKTVSDDSGMENVDMFSDLMRICFSEPMPQKKVSQSIDYMLEKSDERIYIYDLSTLLFKSNVMNQKNVGKSLHDFFDVTTLFKHQKINAGHVKIAIKKLTDEQLKFLYENVEIKDKDCLIKAIQKGVALEDLYQYQHISGKVMDAAIEKRLWLEKLVRKEMSQKQLSKTIDILVEEGRDHALESLYMYNKLNKKNISKAISVGQYLNLVYKNDMTEEQISRALKLEKELYSLYSNQKDNFTDEQKKEIIEKNKDLDSFFSVGIDLTKEMVNNAIKNRRSLDTLYRYYKLNPNQIDKAIEGYTGLASLYVHQNLSKRQIDKAMDEQVELKSLYSNQELASYQVDKAIDIGEGLSSLFVNKNIDMTSEQISEAIKKNSGDDLYHLYRNRKLTQENIQTAFENPSYIAELYEHQQLTEQQIYKAIEMGINTEVIYEHQKLTSHQLDYVIFEKKEVEKYPVIFKNQNLPDFIIRKIINQSISTSPTSSLDVGLPQKEDRLKVLLENRQLGQKELERIITNIEKKDVLKKIFDSQEMTGKTKDLVIERYGPPVLRELYYRQPLTLKNIENAIEKGEEIQVIIVNRSKKFNEKLISKLIKKGIGLHEAYEHLDLSAKNIDEAIDKGEELENLISNNTLQPYHIEKLIDKRQHLSLLLNQDNLTDEHKEQIYNILYKKYGFSGKREGKLLSDVPAEINPIEFLEVYNKAIETKIDDNPLASVVGEYEIKDLWSELKEVVEHNGYSFKPNNVKYVYKGNRKQKLGKFLKNNDREDLMKLLTTVTNEDKQKALFSEQEFNPRDYKLVISDDPADIAVRSNAKKHVQVAKCEAIGHSHGGGILKKGGGKGVYGTKNGWRDDIKANNLVAILKDKKTDDWHARAAIRWCNREDDGLPDAFVEKVYTKDNKKRKITEETIIDVLNQKGFTGIEGPVKCVTGYPFSGYVDYDPSQSGKGTPIVYNVDERPKSEGST